MTPPPAESDARLSLADAAALLSTQSAPLQGREKVKARAGRSLIQAWAATTEEIVPVDHARLVDEAFAEAVEVAGGDKLRAAIMMQTWQPPEDVAWQSIIEHDEEVPASFWRQLPLNDDAWATGSFLGRSVQLEGYEFNLRGIFFDRAAIEALAQPLRLAPTAVPPPPPGEAPAIVRPQVQSSRGFTQYDRPFAVEIVRRVANGEAASFTAAADALLRERQATGEKINGNSDPAIIRRWQRAAGRLAESTATNGE